MNLKNKITAQMIKDKSISIKEFGIGFIQVKLDNIQYINFYTNKVTLFENSIAPHNHQEDFISRIISGTIFETIYYVYEDNNGQSVFCGCGDTDSIITEKYSYSVNTVNVHNKSDIYYRSKEDFHSVIAENNTITIVTKINPDNNHDAIIIADKSEYKSKGYTEDQLWYIVNEILNEVVIYGII